MPWPRWLAWLTPRRRPPGKHRLVIRGHHGRVITDKEPTQ